MTSRGHKPKYSRTSFTLMNTKCYPLDTFQIAEEVIQKKAPAFTIWTGSVIRTGSVPPFPHRNETIRFIKYQKLLGEYHRPSGELPRDKTDKTTAKIRKKPVEDRKTREHGSKSFPFNSPLAYGLRFNPKRMRRRRFS